jgi:hypothetical protein
MRKAISGFIVLSAAVLAIESGCSGAGSPFGADYSGPHACALLTPALAQSAIGSDAKLAQSIKPSQFVTQCQYRGKVAAVTVRTGTWGWLKAMAAGTPLPRMGDEASINPMGLFVRKGDRGLTVLVSIYGEFSGAAADTVEARQYQLEKQLAPKLLSKL